MGRHAARRAVSDADHALHERQGADLRRSHRRRQAPERPIGLPILSPPTAKAPAMNAALGHDVRGSAAAEMALVLPLLLALMFGSLELGDYFLSEHVLLKGVRDGAVYAARQDIPL